MKKAIVMVLVFCMAVSMAGCSGGASDAGKVLEAYLKNLQDGEYDSAYDMLTGFDQGNISKELFLEWQTAAAKISVPESFELDKKVDKFTNYEYMGAKFKKAYGFRVLCERKALIPDAGLKGYDTDDYRIMVAEESDGLRIALLLTTLEETVKEYKRLLGE